MGTAYGPGDQPAGIAAGSLQGVIGAVAVGILIHRGGIPLLVNPALASLLGYDSPDALLASPESLVPLAAVPEAPAASRNPQADAAGARVCRLARRDGFQVWVEVTARPLRWEGAPATQVTVVDSSDRRRAEYLADACQLRIQQVEEVAQLGIWEYSVETRQSHWSAGMYRIFGKSIDEPAPAGLDYFDLVHPEDRQQVRTMFEGSFRAGDRFSTRYRILRPDGSVRYCRGTWEMARRPDGKPWKMLGVLADVTEAHAAEMAEQERARLLEAIVDSVPYTVSAKDAQGRFTLVNAQMAGRLGVPREELLGRRVREVPGIGADAAEQIEQEDLQILATGQPIVLEAVRGRLTRQVDRWHRVIKYPLKDEQGRAVGVIGWAEDITERVLAESRRDESQLLLQNVIDTIPFSVFVKDRDGRYVMANSLHARVVGLTPSSLVGKRLGELPGIGYEVVKTAEEEDREVLATGKMIVKDDVPSMLRRNLRFMFRLTKMPLRDSSGTITGVIGIAEDVTDRAVAKRRLRDHERLLQTLIDTLPENITLKDRDGRFRLVNDAFARAHGMAKEDVLGKGSTDIFSWPEHTPRWLAMDRKVLETGTSQTDIDHELKLADGSLSARVLQKVPFRDDKGEIVGILTVSHDITERKRVERNLRTNEHLLQTVIDTLPVSISLAGQDGRIRLVNGAFARIRGVTKAAALGKRYDEVFHWREHTPRWMEMERRILIAGEPIRDVDHELTHADGTRTTRELHKVPFRDDDGAIVGILSVSYDITERKRAEREMREQSHLLQTLIDTLPQAVCLLDLQGRYVVVNDAFARAHAMTKEEALVARAEDLLGGAIQNGRWLEADRQVRETGQAVYLDELPFTTPQGEPRVRNLYKFPFWNRVGELVGTMGVSEDITDRIRDQMALFQAQKLESLGLLAGGIAHDFNNLLTGISGNAQLALADLHGGHPAAKSVRIILHATDMAAGLTRQMLAIAGKATLQPRPVDVNDLASSISELLRAIVPKSVLMRRELGEGMPAILADPSQIQQVIMNLITNAAEAIAGTGEIVLRTGQVHADREYLARCQLGQNLDEGAFAYVEVSDTGHGMGPETVDRIFEPFYTTKVTGRGLGLAAVLGIVRSHKGAVRVVSLLEAGTTFRILFPVLPEDPGSWPS